MTGTRDGCPELGAYERLRTTAALGSLAGRDPVALARAQTAQSHEAVADRLSRTTTLWLPVWAAGVAVAVAAVAWTADRAWARRAAV
jgi:hypothetical protein